MVDRLSTRKWPVPAVPAKNEDPLAHALALVAFPTFLGAVGALLDSLLGTGPILLLVLAVGGVVASFASAFYRYDRKIARHETGKPWTRRSGERAPRAGTGYPGAERARPGGGAA